MEKGQRMKRKGIGIYPTRDPLQLFSRGSAYGVAMDRVDGLVALIQSSGVRFAKYFTIILRLSDDNAKTYDRLTTDV